MSEEPTARIVAPEPAGPVPPAVAVPTISVVIPAFEAAATIGETVDSVLAQTSAPHEVIVVDDGSTDALDDALAPYGDAVRLLRLPHRGVAAARNAGTEAASGDFVLVVDADDVLLPGKLEALAALGAARPDLDLLSTDVLFEQEGRRAGRFGAANPFESHGQRRAILERCFVGWPAARRARLVEAGGFDDSFRTSHDWECWIRMILSGSSAGLHDEPLSIYRVHAGSITAGRVATLSERVQMLEKVLTHPGLHDSELQLVEQLVDAARARAAVAATEEALRERRPDRRRRALAVAGMRAVPLRVRVGAAAAATAPGLARAWLGRSSRRSPLERSVPGAALD
jgi:hypothetical protein